MSRPNELIKQVLDAAKAQGLEQQELARAAGVAPETVSRVKKRKNIDLSTLDSLACAAGLVLTLEKPRRDAQGSLVRNRSSLADPSRGLAWSNPFVTNEVLCRNALARGSFELILTAVLDFGLEFVRSEWARLMEDNAANMSHAAIADVERQLRNIAKGVQNASS